MKKLLESLLEQKNIFKPPTEEELVKRFIKRYNSKLNSDGTYDFDCNLYDVEGVVKDGKFTIKFGKVEGDFNCSDSGLISLKGAPKYVGGFFDCSDNQLTSLEGAPKHVGESFSCDNNNLTSLKGAPKYVGKGFYCSDNQLTSLEGAPKYVGGSFDCRGNQEKFTKEDVRKVSEVKGRIEV